MLFAWSIAIFDGLHIRLIGSEGKFNFKEKELDEDNTFVTPDITSKLCKEAIAAKIGKEAAFTIPEMVISEGCSLPHKMMKR